MGFNKTTAVTVPLCHVYVNEKNVFFVKVACNSSDTFKHARIEASAVGSCLKFSTHHLSL